MKFFRSIRSWNLLALLFLAAWTCIYYWPVAIGQRVFSEGDINWIHLPIRAELSRALAQGRLPLWSPSVQAGFPLLAGGQGAALYPLDLLFGSFLPAPIALSYTVLFNLSWTMWGMYLLARSWGFQISGALLAALGFGFGGAMTARVSHPDVLTTATWLPWLVFLQERYWQARLQRKRTVPWFLLISFSLALQFLGGSPHLAFLNVGAFALFGTFGPALWMKSSSVPSRNWQVLLRPVFHGVIMIISSLFLGIGLAAIQLLPTAELVGFSIRRGELGTSFFTSYSLEPFALTQFLLPFWYLGEPSASNMEFWGYLGVISIFLAALAPLLRRDKRTWFLLFFGVLSLSLALGGLNPIYAYLYDIPVFNRFRVPARFLFPFVFAAALLAATGFEELQTRLRDAPEDSRRVYTLAGVMTALVAGVIFLAYRKPSEFWAQAWLVLPGFLAVSSTGALLAAVFRWTTRLMFGVIVLGLAIFDLATFSAPFLSTLTRMASPAELVQVPRTVLAMDNVHTVYRVFVNKFPSVTPASVRATLWSGFPLLFGKDGAIVGYMPFSLALQRNEEYINAMSLPMRNLMNIRYYLLPLETAPLGEPSPFDASEPDGGLTLDILGQQPSIAPTHARQIEVTSYTDQTGNLPDGLLVGEIVVTFDNGDQKVIPIRLGIETGDWAYDGIAELQKLDHTKPARALAFPAYLSALGHEFQGHKYVARYDVTSGAVPVTVTAVGVHSLLPRAELTIEHISLIDEVGHSVSLASLLHRNDMTLAFRSHTAAMWENRDVLPRAFMVHEAEIVKDDQVLERMKSPGFHPDQVVLLGDANSAVRPGSVSQGGATDEVVIMEYKPERVVLQVATENVGYLILTDSWYPGWMATVDGRTAPIFRADYIFRAVPIEAGGHIVIFEYHPLSFTLGVAISALSVLFSGVVVGVAHFWTTRSALRN